MEIEPDYGDVYFNYGNLLSDEGNYVEAAQLWVQCVQRQQLWREWCLLYCSFSSFSFEKAARYEQVYPKVLNNLATTYFRLGKPQEAHHTQP